MEAPEAILKVSKVIVIALRRATSTFPNASFTDPQRALAVE